MTRQVRIRRPKAGRSSGDETTDAAVQSIRRSKRHLSVLSDSEAVIARIDAAIADSEPDAAT